MSRSMGAGGPSCLLRVSRGGLRAQRSESREGQHESCAHRKAEDPQQLAGLPVSWIRSHVFPEAFCWPHSFRVLTVKTLLRDLPAFALWLFPSLIILEDPENGVLGLVPILEVKKETFLKRFTYKFYKNNETNP